MKICEARKLIKEYYGYNNEKATVKKKLTRKVRYIISDGEADWFEVESFLCRVNKKEPVYTICAIEYDSHGKPYASELTHGDDEKELAENWIHEFDED